MINAAPAPLPSILSTETIILVAGLAAIGAIELLPVDINNPDGQVMTLLIHACVINPERVNSLIKVYRDRIGPNPRDMFGRTTLTLACRYQPSVAEIKKMITRR